MFGRSIFIFIFFLICLGAGTIWIVERETGADLIPNQHQYITSYKVRSFYLTYKIKLRNWWNSTFGKNSDHLASVRYEKTDPKQPAIVKWQDENGTWHFEYQKSPSPGNQ